MALLSFKWLMITLSTFFFSLNEAVPPSSGSGPLTGYHPFYVSVTEINHNAKEKALEVSCKLFAEDIEDILRQQYKIKVDLTNGKQVDQHNKLLTDYMTKHLAFAADSKPVKLKFIGFEKESESLYVYFEVENLPALKKLDVTNTILQDFNNSQINIMHVVINGNRKSYKLDYPNKQASFQF